MGIPYLAATLEPYSVTRPLRDEIAIIDGPALAYHVLHLCRLNGVLQPSYRLLGEATIAWLDAISTHQVDIEAIYFDGYLPIPKRRVRMERLLRSTTQVTQLHSINPRGCPTKQIAPGSTPEKLDLFATGSVECRSFADPPFLVPAVIETLRSNVRYSVRVILVPGEADTFCARHAILNGGIVLTSDSDLLVHSLGDAGVVFFRDVQTHTGSAILCSCYTPTDICEKLGQPPSEGLTRLAYERQRSPHASLSQIIRACSSPPVHENEYAEFCTEYRSTETTETTEPSSPLAGYLPRSQCLDPRLSELVVQLQRPLGSSDDVRIFLPVLIEDPARGSAWEHSTAVRQLAYSILIGRAAVSAVLEFRRIQSTSQKGRRVDASDADQDYISGLAHILREIRRISEGNESQFWLLACLSLDVVECHKRDKQSLPWSAFQKPTKPPAVSHSSIPWDIVHATAQLQAMWYSLRLLCQAISVCQATGLDLTHTDMRLVQSYLENLPPLAEFPDVDSINRARELPGHSNIVTDLQHMLELPDLRQDLTGPSCGSATGARDEPIDVGVLPIKPRRTVGPNKFDVLSVD